MDNIDQQIAAIEKELRETPHHKATDHHIGRLRAKLAKLKDKQIESAVKSKGGGGGGGYAVKKQGDATVVLVGPPSAGKSTLINKITNAESKVAPYAFTTVSVIPGMLKYRNAYIQILDVPGLIEGARAGKGRGKEVLSVARNSDLVLIMSDVERPKELERITNELEGAGIRLNSTPPNVLIDKKPNGGLNVSTNIKQDFTKDTVREIAHEFGIKSADIAIKEKLSVDRLIDAFAQNRVYIPAMYVLNKSDTTSVLPETNSKTLFISAERDGNIELLKEMIWDNLKLITVYLVRDDEEPSLNNPLIVKTDYTLKLVAQEIGEEFGANKKFARIWGSGARFPGQEVSLDTMVQEGMQVRFY